jgi:DNA polymerase delta subunit 1
MWASEFRAPDEATHAVEMQIVDIQVVDDRPSTVSRHSSREEMQDAAVLASKAAEAAGFVRRAAHVLLFGCTAKGSSVLVHVTNFKPSLFFDMPTNVTLFLDELAKEAGTYRDRLETRTVHRKNAYGWVPNTVDRPPTQRKDFAYLRVRFPTVQSFRRAAHAYSKTCHEGKVRCDTKFMDEASLTPSGWVRITGARELKTERSSHCRIELECLTGNLAPVERDDIAPLLTANLDIESKSASNSFPDASVPDDVVAQIGVVYWRVGTPTDRVTRVVYVNNERCGDVEGAHVMRFADERQMLLGFRHHFVLDADVDVLVTYNGFGFDLPYLWKRAELHGITDFNFLDRLVTRKCTSRNKELSSSALGQNDLFIIDMYGRTNLDLFHWVKAREKLESYKLDDVAEHFLGQKKLEMDYKELFRMVDGTPDEIALVAKYCIQDCYLLVCLADRLQVYASNVGMSRVTHTAMELLVTSGQQIKVINQLVWHGHRMEADAHGTGGYLLNTPRKLSGCATDSYLGATVIDPIVNYYQDPIATLDFASLYPSIILANNFCCSTLVLDPQYENVPGVDYVVIDVSETKRYTWATNMPGLIPNVLRYLLAARKKAKKKMAAAANRVDAAQADVDRAVAAGDGAAADEAKGRKTKAQQDKAVANAEQLALKISANSIYGFTGAVKTNWFCCLGVADSVTYRAREMLYQTVQYVQEFAPCTVVYGDTDSVMVRFHDAKTMQAVADLAEGAATYITNKFPKDIVIEFEKIFHPWILLAKKRYAGLMHEPQDDGTMRFTKLDAKGIELVRRDNCAFAKRCQKKVLDALLYKIDPLLACRELAAELDALVQDKVPLLDFKLSKSRRKDYVNEDLPHLAVVDKMRRRNPGSEPQVGDRVPYVLCIVPNNGKAKTFEKAEDIAYVREHPDECKIDRLYYLQHQVEHSVLALMEHAVEDAASLFQAPVRQLTLQQSGQRSLFEMLGGDEGPSATPVPKQAVDAQAVADDEGAPEQRTLEESMFDLPRPTTLLAPPKKRPKKRK